MLFAFGYAIPSGKASLPHHTLLKLAGGRHSCLPQRGDHDHNRRGRSRSRDSRRSQSQDQRPRMTPYWLAAATAVGAGTEALAAICPSGRSTAREYTSPMSRTATTCTSVRWP